jgi:hypothetical protein
MISLDVPYILGGTVQLSFMKECSYVNIHLRLVLMLVVPSELNFP